MEDISWGLWMTLMGMASVFALLIVMMGLLYGIGWLDRRALARTLTRALAAAESSLALESAVPASTEAGETNSAGLTADQVAAITVAVITHARISRLQGTPDSRVHQPGSQLFASRWVTVGRAFQQQPWTRK